MIVLSVICALFLVALVYSIVQNLRLARITIDVEDALTEALDVCDQSYSRISRVLEMPVALNTPEVKHVLIEISRVRDSILYVSNVLAGPYGGIAEEDETDGS